MSPSPIPTFEKILRSLEPDESKVHAQVKEWKRKEAKDTILIVVFVSCFFISLIMLGGIFR